MVTSYSELIMPKTIPCDGCQIAPTPINLQHTYVLHIKNQAQSYLTFLRFNIQMIKRGVVLNFCSLGFRSR